jgi:hypothetical protein
MFYCYYVIDIIIQFMKKDFVIGSELEEEKDFRFASSLIKIITMIIATFVLVISKYAFIFFAAAILPTIFALFFDRNVHRYPSATICTFNLIGILPYLMKIWGSKGLVDQVTKNIISDVDTWVVVYGAALVGQILYISLPLLFIKLYSKFIGLQVSKLENQRDTLSKAWNIKITK